jgi:putative hemolysin
MRQYYNSGGNKSIFSLKTSRRRRAGFERGRVLKEAKPSKRHWLGVVIVFLGLLFLTPASAADNPESNGSDIDMIGEKEASRNVAIELLEAGIGEYNQALFDAACNTLLKAQNYEKYLTDAERKKLGRYLKAAKNSVLKRKEAIKHIQLADELISSGQFIRAEAHLNAVKRSRVLTKMERNDVKDGLKQIKDGLAEQEKQIKQIYERSVELYRNGQFRAARAGFIKVAQSGLLSLPDGKTAEDYIHKIDVSIGKSVSTADMALFESENKTESSRRSEDIGILKWSEDSGILNKKDIVNANQKVLPAEAKSADFAQSAAVSKNSVAQGYTLAIVKDAAAKVNDCIKSSDFYQAQKVIDNAKKILSENQPHLDKDVSGECNTTLKKLEDEVSAGRKKWPGSLGSGSPLK